jgi:hypothetical protein
LDAVNEQADLRIRAMASDEIAVAADWAAAEGWNPGLGDAACFATVEPGLFHRRARRRGGRDDFLRQLR